MGIGNEVWRNEHIALHIGELHANKLGEKAACHYSGNGLQEGTPSFQAYLDVKPRLKKDGQLSLIPLVDKITTGAVGFAARFGTPGCCAGGGEW